MSLRTSFARLATKVVAVAVLAWAGSPARAADQPAPPQLLSAAPVGVGDPGCATCQHGAPAGGCATCKHHTLLAKNKKPFQVNLCPGGCFGYFQTQWRKWDEACPYPYLGTGVGDAPKPPVPVVNIPRTGGELSPPRPVPGDPKAGGPLPPIPQPPGGKFVP